VTLPNLNIPLRWIDSNADLAAVCAGWMQSPALAIDSEFVRRRTFYPIPALLQFYDGESVVAVDPLQISDWAPLNEVMTSTAVLKIFHACSEDLEVFWRLLGLIPTPLFDTQIAAGLCGERPSMGYNKLVSALCDVDLPKDETNSDWLKRPLSDNQLQYAVYDVYYLYQIFHQLGTQAIAQDRLDWILADSAEMGAALPTLIDPADYYLRLKGAQRLSRRELAIARGLCQWREELARSSDLPRSWVLKDSAIVSMARIQPTDLPQLGSVKDLQASTARKQGELFLDIVQQGLALAEEDLPPPLPDTLSSTEKQQLQRAQQAVQACAEQLKLAPELLLNRKQISELTLRLLAGRQELLPEDFSPWRKEVLAPVLEQLKQA
jgi:ribonuclease D